MAASVPFNPFVQTTFAGSFRATTEGFLAGTTMDDFDLAPRLAGGVLAATETLPMTGGVAISEYTPSVALAKAAGGNIARATAVANITGFSVFNQAHHMISTPQSTAPSVGSGGGVHFVRLGSNVRLAVAMNPSLVSTDGGLITQQLSWDFAAQRLIAYDASTATTAVTSITSSFSNGVYTFAVVTTVPSLVGAVGDAITVAGVTGTGASLVNGTQVITSFTDASHFSFQITAASGAIATGALAGTITLVNSVGLLNVRVLQTNVGNSRVVVTDPVTGFSTFNPNGSAAVILI